MPPIFIISNCSAAETDKNFDFIQEYYSSLMTEDFFPFSLFMLYHRAPTF